MKIFTPIRTFALVVVLLLVPQFLFAGDGTKENPYTVVELNAQKDNLAASGATVWVKADLKGLGIDGSQTVNGATVITDATATGTAGKEIGYIKVLAANGSVAKTYEQGATASATKFAYDPTTKTITLPTGEGAIATGTNIVYAYERTVSGTKVTDPSDTFSETREVWIHCFGKDACDNEFYIAIYIPRADFSGEFSLELGGDQVVHNFSFDGMTDLCNPAQGNNLFELIVYTGDEGTTNP